jgi:hypothetical protein
MHVYFIFFPKKKHLTLPPQLFLCLFPIFLCFSLAGTASSIILPEQPAAGEPVHPPYPAAAEITPASAPAAPTAAAAGAAVRTAAASSPSPSFLAPFLLLPLPLPRLPGASRIQTNKETKSPESSSTTISSHFIIWMCAQMHVDSR